MFSYYFSDIGRQRYSVTQSCLTSDDFIHRGPVIDNNAHIYDKHCSQKKKHLQNESMNVQI